MLPVGKGHAACGLNAVLAAGGGDAAGFAGAGAAGAAGAFFAAAFFFAAGFFAADFFAAFFAGAFFAADFLAGDFFAADFFAGDFFAADFFAVAITFSLIKLQKHRSPRREPLPTGYPSPGGLAAADMTAGAPGAMNLVASHACRFWRRQITIRES